MSMSRIFTCLVAAVTAMSLWALPATATPNRAAAVTAAIGASGTNLTLGGQPYRFIGVDAYELATDWGANAGCGAMLSDSQLTDFFAALPAGAVVRFQAFQETTGINPSSLGIDWKGLDRVFAAATAANIKLIPVLGGQGSGCNGGQWEDPAWYEGGYTTVDNTATNSDGRGLQPLSYLTWVTDVVTRYASSPALGMWEPIGEAEASTCPSANEPLNCSGNQTCPDEAVASAALWSFFTTIGGLIHRLDPAHLVEAGLLGGGQCGTQGPDYQTVISSPGIDVRATTTTTRHPWAATSGTASPCGSPKRRPSTSQSSPGRSASSPAPASRGARARVSG